MTTFAELVTAVSRDLRDPSQKTFSETDVKDLVNSALAEVGRIAPRRFQEDITPVADAMEYTPLIDEFGQAVPEIELVRVELWDGTQTPAEARYRLTPADQAPVAWSQNGWKVWGGVLELPRTVPVELAGQEADWLIRVWGYAPYVPLVDDADVVPVSTELEWAMRAYCRVEALNRLVAERDLFTQWQTRSGNSDVSPAALLNGLNIALEEWRRRSRAIFVLREAPG